MSSIATLNLVYDILRLDEKLILQELRRRSVDFRLINLDKAAFNIGDLSRDSLEGELFLIRSISHTRSVLIARILEELGALTINSSSAIDLGNNKLLSLLRLARVGLPVPETLFAFSSEVVLRAAESVGLGKVPLVIKPVSGSWGRLVSLVCSVEELNLLLKHRSKMESPLMKIYMLQEYIEKPQRDIRIIVVDGEAVAGIYRYAPSGEWRTNTARGGQARPLEIDEELSELSVKACEAIGARYAGVDLIESKSGYRVLEVNVVPEFKNVARVTGVNIAARIVEMLLNERKR